MQSGDVNRSGPSVALLAGCQNFDKPAIMRQALDLHFDGSICVEAGEATGAYIKCDVLLRLFWLHGRFRLFWLRLRSQDWLGYVF